MPGIIPIKETGRKYKNWVETIRHDICMQEGCTNNKYSRMWKRKLTGDIACLECAKRIYLAESKQTKNIY